MSLLEASNSLNFFSSKIFVKASQTTHHPLPSVSASSGDPLLQLCQNFAKSEIYISEKNSAATATLCANICNSSLLFTLYITKKQEEIVMKESKRNPSCFNN